MSRSPQTARASQVARGGFTLVESLISIALIGLAGSALLLATHGTLNATDDNVDELIAKGVAKQLLDELLNQPYMEPGLTPYQTTLGPNPWEAAGNGRERFNDTDDYNGYVSSLTDRFGQPLGQENDAGALRVSALRIDSLFFSNWQAAAEVYYVSEADPSQRLPSGTSNFRAAEVTIIRTNPDGSKQPLAQVRRVYAYVPPP